MTSRPDISHSRALELFHAEQFEQALDIYMQLVALNKEDAQAWHMAGAIAGMTGDYISAKTYSEMAIRLSPQSHGPRLNLASVLQISGDLQGALTQIKQAIELQPEDPQIITRLASLYAQLGEMDMAESHLQSVIRNNPHHTEAYNALGNIYRETGRLDAAVASFQQALIIRPDYVDALCNLGAVLCEQLKFPEADSCYTTALQYQPENPAILHGYGNLHQSTGDFDKAKACYQKALIGNPSDIGIRSSLASLCERCGELSHASDLLAPLVQSRHFSPDSAITYAKLCKNNGDYEAAIRVLNDVLKTPLRPGKIIDIYFALGELFDRSGKYDDAFHYFRKANELDTSPTPETNQAESVRKVTEFYSRQRIPMLNNSTNRSELPVFIVGMPRTGTSLVEQILASHPQVCPGGERSDIFTIVDTLQSKQEQHGDIHSLLETMTTTQLNKLSTSYLENIRMLSKERLRFTDKTPLHGILLGFISQLLPKSRVIICKRDPMDTCLSIYFHRFNAFHGYAKHLDTLGAFYREYYALMEHWINTLDINILQIEYEELVRNPDEKIRSIIGFCGLDWDDNCLSFHLNKRTINTPSYDQVRHPIYTSSIERWKQYDKYLEPLRTALKDTSDD